MTVGVLSMLLNRTYTRSPRILSALLSVCRARTIPVLDSRRSTPMSVVTIRQRTVELERLSGNDVN